MLQDCRLAVRSLLRSKAFTGAAVLTLAIGVTGSTLMFTLIQGVLLRPLPVVDEERVFVAWRELRSSGFTHYPFGDREIETVARASRLLERVAGVDSNGVSRWTMLEDGASSAVRGALVTGRFFEVLGVGPVLGRALTAADDVEQREHVVVISHALWQRRYGGARDAIGRRLTINGLPVSIAGVMPPDLDFPAGVEIWMPTSAVPTSAVFGNAARREIDLIGRSRPGVTLAQAASELEALLAPLERDAALALPRGLRPVVRPLVDVIVGDVRGVMLAIFGACGLVLLVASANVANLLLLRGEGRRTEFAIREALGAARARIVRQWLAEGFVLAAAAAVVAMVVTAWSIQTLIAIVPDGLPRIESVRLDPLVVLFAPATAALTALGAALAPAAATQQDVVARLKGAGRIGQDLSRSRRRALVVAQVALAVIVVSAASLLTRTVLNLQAVDVGVAGDQLVFIDLSRPDAKRDDRDGHARFLDEVVAGLEALPAVQAVTPVNTPPFAGEGGWDVPFFTAEGQSHDRAQRNPSLNLESIHANYFATFQVPLVLGRPFSAADREGAIDVAIVSQDVAARTWPGEDPLGKRLKMGAPDSPDRWRTVVGVAASTRYRELTVPRPTLYLPANQFLMTAEILVLRTSLPIERLASALRERIRSVDADTTVMRIAPFRAHLDRPLARPRFNALLIGIFGVAALVLAAIGVYALMAASVRQRDRELGVRVALGATPRAIRRLVLGESVGLTAAGVALGLVGAVASGRLLSSALFEVDPLDPVTLGLAGAVLLASALVVTWLPARRAARIDPVAMLRSE